METSCEMSGLLFGVIFFGIIAGIFGLIAILCYHEEIGCFIKICFLKFKVYFFGDGSKIYELRKPNKK